MVKSVAVLGLLAAAGIAWVHFGPIQAPAAVISVDDAHALAGRGDLVIVDVRTPGEWSATGLPPGAAAIGLHDPRGDLDPDFVERVTAAVGGDRAAPVALICARGVRSSIAARLLRASGFTNVHDISAGMLGHGSDPGWLERGLPVEPCAVCGAKDAATAP